MRDDRRRQRISRPTGTPTWLGVEAQRDCTADSMLDSSAGQALGHLHGQFRRSQGPFDSRHRRLSRAQMSG